VDDEELIVGNVTAKRPGQIWVRLVATFKEQGIY